MIRPSPRSLIVAAVAIVLVAGLGVGAWLWAEARERRAVSAYVEPLARLAAARSTTLSPEARAAISRDLESALAQYPSASVAPDAAYELGNLRYAERDWARARSAWEVVSTHAPSPTLRTLARTGIGYAWEAEGDLAKAGEAFSRALSGLRPGDFSFEELLMAQARVQEVRGEKAAAVETYRRLLREMPQSLRADDVRSRLGSLGAAP
ncbi:MAG TPA: tetratricopeptide repeat protein [Methylomirabilota bacterium]|jgi:tetratricopeptide (TPR) repeat protein